MKKLVCFLPTYASPFKLDFHFNFTTKNTIFVSLFFILLTKVVQQHKT